MADASLETPAVRVTATDENLTTALRPVVDVVLAFDLASSYVHTPIL